jgi:hypothetical protein
MLRQLLFLTFFLGLGLLARAQDANAIDRYFQQYLDDERFSVVYISPKVFQLLDRLDLGDVDVEDADMGLVKDVASDLRGLRILSTEVNHDAFYREAKQRIDTKQYEVLMTIRQKNETDVEFLIHEDSEGIIRELLLLANSSDSFTLLSFVGKIDLNKVVQMANELDKE